MTYSIVVDGEVVSSGHPRPTRVGRTYVGAISDIRRLGYYPEVGTKPATTAYEKAVVDTAVLTRDVVEVTYRVEQLPPPAHVTRRQGKQQLVISGIDGQVQAAIDNIVDDVDRKITRIWYTDSLVWERRNSQLLALADALGLSSTQVDDMFKAASQL